MKEITHAVFITDSSRKAEILYAYGDYEHCIYATRIKRLDCSEESRVLMQLMQNNFELEANEFLIHTGFGRIAIAKIEKLTKRQRNILTNQKRCIERFNLDEKQNGEDY